MAFPTSEKFIVAAEIELGCFLPDWLRTRLVQENGGTLEVAGEYWTLFAVFDKADRRHIAGSTSNIAKEAYSARNSEGFRSSAIAIAHNGGGDYPHGRGRRGGIRAWFVRKGDGDNLDLAQPVTLVKCQK